jgi:hypothetical protein
MTTHDDLLAQVQEYLFVGGLFNPESMHPQDAVRDLIIDLTAAIRSLRTQRDDQHRANVGIADENYALLLRAESAERRLAEVEREAVKRCAQEAFDQTSDDPQPGDWNAACEHIASKLRATIDATIKESAPAQSSTADPARSVLNHPACNYNVDGWCHDTKCMRDGKCKVDTEVDAVVAACEKAAFGLDRNSIRQGDIAQGAAPLEPVMSITVWKDGSYLQQKDSDDYYCRNDPDWLCSIPLNNAIPPGYTVVPVKPK